MAHSPVLDPTTTTHSGNRRRGFRLTRIWLLIFFLVNLGFTGWLAVSSDKASDDVMSYYAQALNLVDGKGFSRNCKLDVVTPELQPPFLTRSRILYPALVSLAFRVATPSVPVANLVAAFFKALLVIPVVLLAKYLFDDDVTGVWAGVLFTLVPAYNSLGSIGMPETTTSALYYLCLLALVGYYQSGRRALLLAGGLAVSFSYLARPEGLFLMLFGVVTVVLRPRELGVKGSRGGSALFDHGAFLALPVLMLTVGSAVVYGRPGVISPYQTSLVTLPDWADYYDLPGFTWSSYLAAIGGVSGALSVRVYNCLLFLRHAFADGLWLDRIVGLLPWTFVPAIVVGLLRPLAPRKRLYLGVLAVFMLAQFVLTIGFPGYPRMSADFRHGQIVGPFILIVAAAGLRYLLRGAAPHRAVLGRIGQAYGGLLVLNFVFFCVICLSLQVNDTLWTPIVEEPAAEAARWTKAHLPPDAILMSRKPVVVNYFSGQTAVMLPSASYADIMKYSQRHRGTHFVITDLERGGLPNLVQGLDVYADHFQRVFTSDTFSIVAVKSYDYGGQRPAVDADSFVGPNHARREPFHWRDLWAVSGSGAWNDARDVWAQWGVRAQKGIWSLAKDHTVVEPMRNPVGAAFGDAITLLGYDLNVDRVGPGDSFELTLFWRCDRPVDRDYTVFTHALDSNGQVRAQTDQPPLEGARPTSRWEPGEIIRDRFVLSLNSDSPPGQYSVEVGLYDFSTGKRLAVRDGSGADVPERRVLAGPLRVK